MFLNGINPYDFTINHYCDFLDMDKIKSQVEKMYKENSTGSADTEKNICAYLLKLCENQEWYKHLEIGDMEPMELFKYFPMYEDDEHTVWDETISEELKEEANNQLKELISLVYKIV